MGIRKVLIGLAAAVAVATGLVMFLPSGDADASGKELSHSAAAAKLRKANISWTSSGHCSDRNNSHCTSFSGIKSGTIQYGDFATGISNQAGVLQSGSYFTDCRTADAEHLAKEFLRENELL